MIPVNKEIRMPDNAERCGTCAHYDNAGVAFSGYYVDALEVVT